MATVQQIFKEMEDQEKMNECTSRWISRNVQINPFITRSEIRTDLEGAGINASKDIMSRALYRTGFHSRSPRKVPLLKTKHVKDWLKFVKTYEKKGMQFWEKVIWSGKTKFELFKRNTVFGEKMALPSRSTIPSPQLSVSIMILGCFSSESTGELQVIYGRIMVAWTGRFKRRTFRNLQLL